MSYHPEFDSHSRNKTKVYLNMSNYVTTLEVRKEQMLIHQN